MKIKVAYYSKSGNTKKLAEAIAKAARVTPIHLDSSQQVEADVLFLGASVYWAGIDGKVKEFINQLDPTKVKEVAVFSTSALAQRAFPDIKNMLEKRGIKVAEENFYCRGKFMSLHKDRPNEKDLKDVAAFAQDVLAKRG